MSKIQGVIFDLDNTLVLSEKLHFEALKNVVEELSVDLQWDYYQQEYLGLPIEAIVKSILAILNVEITDEKVDRIIEEKREEFKVIIKEDGLKPVPGAKAFLDKLKAENIPVTLATSSLREMVEEVLYSAGLIDYFKRIVTVEDVKNPKPAPDIFIEAARTLNADVKKTIVFEDSYQGITAAEAAGAYPVALTTTYPPAGLVLRGAEEYVEDYTPIDFAVLEKNFEAWLQRPKEKKANPAE
jgi:HAD superfamily hydrolase (TIGR01509 family)